MKTIKFVNENLWIPQRDRVRVMQLTLLKSECQFTPFLQKLLMATTIKVWCTIIQFFILPHAALRTIEANFIWTWVQLVRWNNSLLNQPLVLNAHGLKCCTNSNHIHIYSFSKLMHIYVWYITNGISSSSNSGRV